MNRRTLIWSGVGAVALLAAGGGAWIASLPPAPVPKGAPPIPEEETAATLAALKPPKRARPLIAIIGINEGTETNDYLMPFGILARAGIGDVVALATNPGPVTLYPVLKVAPDATIAEFDARHPEGADYVIVPAMHRDDDPATLSWIKSQAAKGATIIGVCAGAKVVAAAGLLDGRRATTHWASCAALQRRFPAIKVERDPIFVRDGNVWTSAGVTAGMDLALALVDDDLGRDVALEVARWLVVYLQRPGGQAQFSAHLEAQIASRQPLREVQAWIAEHLAGDLSVPALAARAGMSVRNFSRAFRAEVGMTPADYVEVVRVDAARRALETSRDSVDAIARSCGFGTVATMHRVFRRRVHTTPARYRGNFAPSPA